MSATNKNQDPNPIALISGILSDKQVSVWHYGVIIRQFLMVCLIVEFNAKQKLGKRDFYKEAWYCKQ